jgi:uncharacterized protein (TIGR03437 family)
MFGPLFRWTVLAVFLSAVAAAQPPLGYAVTTIAGTGTAGYSGDGGEATEAQIHNPSALALDSSGNLYIADQFNSRIRKITGGAISTVAGNGTRGDFGDTGQATSAGISFPQGVGVDGAGNIYIADSANHKIRRVSTTGVITSIVGGTFPAFAGDGGPANNAHINQPTGIAVDSAGNFYFTDLGNNRIRKVTANGTITTFAGNGVYGRLGDGGPATSANLNAPSGLALDAAGNLYIADTENGMIRKVTPDGIITTVAGTGINGFSGDGGPATRAMLNRPKGVAVDAAGLVYIADTFNSRIRVVSLNGTISTIAGNSYIGDSGDGSPGTAVILRFPSALLAGSGGRLYVADTQNSRIRLLTPILPAAPAGPPSINSVAAAGSFGGFASATSPGSWIEIYGANLAGNTREWTAAEFTASRAPVALDGTRVTIGGRDAFVSFISPGQVNAQAPSDVENGPQEVRVVNSAGSSAPLTITVNPVQPGLLAPAGFRVGARQYAAALLSDGRSYALPVASLPGVSARPARPGETIVLFGVGFGGVDPDVPAGQVAQGAAAITAPFRILFGGVEAGVAYAGLSPGAVGLYQFNVTVPEVENNDAVPVTFQLGGTAGGQTLYIAVRR